MPKMNRNELILQMSYRDLLFSLVISQALFLVVGFSFHLFLFDSFSVWLDLISFSPGEIFLWGIVPGVAIVGLDVLLMKFLPEEAYDDGGLNKKLFSQAPVFHIFLIALLVAVCEEWLFRGILQSAFGIYIASTVFALVHFRYLKKPALFLSVILLSFLLGIAYKWTGNLLVPVTMHFTIDFLLGLILRREGKEDGIDNYYGKENIQ